MKITIFGLAGSGTSTIGKLLSTELNYEFKSSGNIMRQWADELGYTIYEFEDKLIKNNDSFDIKLDNKVSDYGQNNDNFIFESRLAWNFIPDSFKIYLKCEVNERYNRIHNRESGVLKDIIDKTSKRESELVERYSNIYPNITFPPKDDIFDLVIDVTNKNPEEIIDIIKSDIFL